MNDKGKKLERTINELLKRYKKKGIFAIKIPEAKTTKGVFTQKSPFDYIIFYDSKLYAFDAKENKTSTINIKSMFKEHQIDALHKVWLQKGEAFFLVYFTTLKVLVRYDIEIVLKAITNNIKSLKPEDGEILKGLNFLEVEL